MGEAQQTWLPMPAKSHKELCQAGQLAGLHHSHQQNTDAQHTETMEMMLRSPFLAGDLADSGANKPCSGAAHQ